MNALPSLRISLLAAAGALVALTSSGCTVLTVIMTDSSQLSSTPVDVRVTTHRADVDGKQCYVEKNAETISRAHVPAEYRWGALVEGLAGGTTAAFVASKNDAGQSTCPNCLVYGLPFLADAVLTGAYIFWRDDLVYTSHSWEESNETVACEK